MAHLEPLAFCSMEEYRRHEPDRIGLEEIESGQLYTIMSELRGSEREASRSTVRIAGESATSRLVTVTFYDDKLDEGLEVEACFDETDYIYSVNPRVVLYDRRHGQEITIAKSYLRDYFEDMYYHLLCESVELELAGSVS